MAGIIVYFFNVVLATASPLLPPLQSMAHYILSRTTITRFIHGPLPHLRLTCWFTRHWCPIRASPPCLPVECPFHILPLSPPYLFSYSLILRTLTTTVDGWKRPTRTAVRQSATSGRPGSPPRLLATLVANGPAADAGRPLLSWGYDVQ